MPRTIQIRDVDDEVYDAVRQRAAEYGMSVPEFLRREVERIATRISVREWVARTQRGSGGSDLDTVTALDELRGAWPE